MTNFYDQEETTLFLMPAPDPAKPRTTAGTPDRVLHAFIWPDKKAYITTRADRLDWTPSKFGAKLVDWWLAQGAPPIHPLEEKLPPIPMPKFEPPKYERASKLGAEADEWNKEAGGGRKYAAAKKKKGAG